jgi:hypothetical protein
LVLLDGLDLFPPINAILKVLFSVAIQQLTEQSWVIWLEMFTIMLATISFNNLKVCISLSTLLINI